MQIYYCNSNCVREQDLPTLYPLLTQQRIEKIRTLPQDKKASSLVAGLLVRYALKKHNIPDTAFSVLGNGKPILTGGTQHISISHSANHVVVAIDKVPIGIDIQKISIPRRKVLEKVCSLEELQFIDNAPSPAVAFTTLWALKESYVKLLGCGIAADLRKICFCIESETITGPSGYTFLVSKEAPITQAILAVCTKMNVIADCPKTVTWG